MLLSLVIPVYNEAESLPLLMTALRAALPTLAADCEIIFIDDGSRDGSLGLLQQYAVFDPRVKVLSFSRNFGHQRAITAGLDFANGDAVIVMDADLQDPPEFLATMLERFREGYDVVSAQRVSREGDSFFKRATAHAFYWIMRKMVDDRLVPEVGDFRLFSRAAVLAVREFREQHRFMRGLVAWLGLREAVVPLHRSARQAGETKYGLFKMLRFAWIAITSFSGMPLRLALGFGSALSGLSFLYFFFAAYAFFFTREVVPGWTSLVALQCLFSGATLLAVGIIGDYVARIYEESKQRPLYIVAHTANIQADPEMARAVVIAPRLSERPVTASHSAGR